MANRSFVAHEQISDDSKCVESNNAKIILFATTTCPNCKMAEKFLGDSGIAYEKIYADQNPDLAKQFEIKQAPTLVITDGTNVEKVMNVSNIRKFAETYKK